MSLRQWVLVLLLAGVVSAWVHPSTPDLSSSCSSCVSHVEALGSQLFNDEHHWGSIHQVERNVTSSLIPVCERTQFRQSECFTGLKQFDRFLHGDWLHPGDHVRGDQYYVSELRRMLTEAETIEEVCLRLSQCTRSCCVTENVPEQRRLSVGTSSDEMAVSWVTGAETPSPVVRYGENSTRLVHVLPVVYSATFSVGGWVGWVHHALLTGLVNDATYHYQVGDNVTHVWSNVTSFRAPPPIAAQPSRSFTTLMFADQGRKKGAPALVERIARLTDKHQLDAVILAGDIAYADGVTVKWDEWGRLVEPYAKNIPQMVIPGNHDTHYNFLDYRMRFAMPGFRAPVPEAPEEGGSPEYYSFDLANIHYVVLNLEDHFAAEADAGGAQQVWLIDDLAAANLRRNVTPWIVVVIHRPLYCTVGVDRCQKEGPKFRGMLEKIFMEARVNLVLGGHVHSYDRQLPVYDYDFVLPSNGDEVPSHFRKPPYPIYVVVGTAGKELDTKFVIPPPWNAAQIGEWGYGLIKSTSSSLRFQFCDLDGNVLDSFYIDI